MNKWDKRWFDIAKVVANWSKDPSTKVGAVIVSPSQHIVTTGYNGMPSGVANTEERWTRPKKYLFVQHAERNAIYQAAKYGRSLEGCTLYTTVFPCSDCMGGIVQVKIKKVVTPQLPDLDRWKESWEVATEMANEAGIEIILIGETNE